MPVFSYGFVRLSTQAGNLYLLSVTNACPNTSIVCSLSSSVNESTRIEWQPVIIKSSNTEGYSLFEHTYSLSLILSSQIGLSISL